GDYDPSGHAAADAIKRTLREDLACYGVSLHRFAITEEQIAEYSLPTRPTKQSDSPARNWRGSECVELDSMPPAELRTIVENAIAMWIDKEAWQVLQKVEREERET